MKVGNCSLANGELSGLENLDTRHEPVGLRPDVLLTLGLIGTVAGFIPMLAGASGINIANVFVQSIGKYGSWNASNSIVYYPNRIDYKYILKSYFRLDPRSRTL